MPGLWWAFGQGCAVPSFPVLTRGLDAPLSAAAVDRIGDRGYDTRAGFREAAHRGG